MTPETADSAGGELVVWSARLMAGLWFTRVLLDVLSFRRIQPGQKPAEPALRRIRLVWTAGAVVCAVHLGLAFAVVHQWSQTRAMEETARQTVERLGVAVGWGVYANEVFCLIWLADAAGWWITGDDPLRARPALLRLRDLGFASMMFFATAVFGPWFWRPVSAVALVFWLVLRWNFAASTTPQRESPSVRHRPEDVD